MHERPTVPSRRRRRTARRVLPVAAAAALAAACAGGTAADAPAGSTPQTAAVAVACATARTVAYATPPGVDPNLTSLDVYPPPAGADGCTGRPLVVWVHGGGWTSGDKSEHVSDKITLFNGAGYVFASINYRLTDKTAVPTAPRYPVHDQDAAGAIAWLVTHADELGVDPERIAVLGHSAGGGIVSAISTDPSYLGASGLALDTVTSAGSMDGEGYDVAAGATTAPVEVQTGYRNVFGDDPAVWAQASPIDHVAAGTGIPTFFVAARGTDWRLAQHLRFIDALHGAGVPTVVLDSTSLEHADLAVDIGAPGDTVITPPLMDFLGDCFAEQP